VRVVLDTNVLISGLMLPQSIPGKIVAVWQSGGFDLALSEPMLEEIARVLSYPKIIKRLQWREAEIAKYISLLRFNADVVEIGDTVADAPRDPNDTPILATLMAGKADCLVTGDEDLLSLAESHPILTPAAFYGKVF
jgi:uncharacterized protein